MFDCRQFSIALLGLLTAGLVPHYGLADPTGSLADPTRPLGWNEPQGPLTQDRSQPVGDLRLQGIFSAGGHKSAMLSGRRVAVGGQVAGATVLAIEHNKVVLRINDEVVVLAASMPSIKSPARPAGETR